MSTGQDDDLQRALRDLRARLEAGTSPTRHDARAVLVPLGERLLAEGPNGVASELDRLKELVRRAPDAWGSAWSRAVEDEMDMACAEHVRSVDPRWLEHPEYDLEYTLDARRRLEARLRALAEIGFAVKPELLASVARADSRLAAHPPPRSRSGSTNRRDNGVR